MAAGTPDEVFQEMLGRLEQTARQLTNKETEITALATRSAILERELVRSREETAQAR
jgi:hypothetical protein